MKSFSRYSFFVLAFVLANLLGVSIAVVPIVVLDDDADAGAVANAVPGGLSGVASTTRYWVSHLKTKYYLSC